MSAIGSLYIFAPNTIIRSTYVNSNFADIKAAYNAHDVATTSVHGITSGDIVGTTQAQDITNKDISSSFIGAVTPNWLDNVGLVNSGTVLSVASADGTAISATNPVYISYPTTAGLWSSAKIIAPITINHGAHASYNFNLGGARNQEAGGSGGWVQVTPLHLYWCVKSGDAYLAISDVPELSQMPNNANYIGDFAAAPTSPIQGNVFIAGTITKADFVDLPLVKAGSVRATLSSVNKWLIAAFDNYDGFGRYNYGRSFSHPTGSMGASTGFHALGPASGYNPAWTTDIINYWLNGKTITVEFNMVGDAGNDGSHAAAYNLTLPYYPAHTNATNLNGCVRLYYAGATTVNPAAVTFNSANCCANFYITATTLLQYSNLSHGNRIIGGLISYQIR